jgi:hypothetical protein
MARGGVGIIAAVPPPGKLRGKPPADMDEPDGDEAPDDYGNDEDKAAETAAAERVGQALGIKNVDAEELCEALKDFLSTIGK